MSLGLGAGDLAALAPWLDALGPLALVELRASAGPASFAARIEEIAVLLFDPGEGTIGVVEVGRDADARGARARFEALAELGDALRGRGLVALDAEATRAQLARTVAPGLAASRSIDAGELFGLLHPDAVDLELATVARIRGGAEPARDSLARVVALARVLAQIARSARAGGAREREVDRILAARLPESPWRPLFEPVDRFLAAALGGEPAGGLRYLEIGASEESPVAFDAGAIASVLADEARGRRHFPGYRARKEQIELARQFVHLLADGGVAKLEGGTGVGKSLAYLAAVIPFAMARAEVGEKQPIVLSTRTKLLQDQLLEKDIAAAARFLGHPSLRALSIKGRANYVCERRLAAILADAGDPSLRRDWQADFAALEACARLRPAGEVGTVPAALFVRRPRLRELLRGSVAARAEQCSREQCGHEKRCPFGEHRRALAKAQLVVANHDLLLRWPPDYPAFSHVIADEGHELASVAEEVYSIRVRPDEIVERLDLLFGRPARGRVRRFATRGLVAASPTKSADAALARNRDDLGLELAGLGRAMSLFADGFGGAELPADAARMRPEAAALAASAATRLEALAGHALREGPERRFELGLTREGESVPDLRDLPAEEEAMRAIESNAEGLLAAARGLRKAFAPDNDDYVGSFEQLEMPYDRWSLVLRPVDPGPAFREEFLGRVESLAVVSATLFVGGDDHAALGELGLAGDGAPTHFRFSVPSPFPYADAMRVVALEGAGDLVEDTAQAIAVLARRLRGRTLGLFTSLARMREVAARLGELLEGEGLEVLAPLRAGEDPGGLVERFRKCRGEAVMLGARRYWQGIDVRGDDLQAVVIEKLPFEVPTELRRRRDLRLRDAGEDPFARASLGHMLLHLKQMVGRLIRSETDRGLVVIVDARPGRGYFRRLVEALPEGVRVERARVEALPAIAEELSLGG